MMTSTTRVGEVIVDTSEDVVIATIDRPGVRNAINDGVIDGLHAAVEVAEGSSARVLVIRGAGGSLCSGADLIELERMRADPVLVEKFMTRLGEVLDKLESAPFVTMAVVEGHAVAGGCELLLSCDVSVASTTARIGDGHLKYGLAPAAGSSVRLSQHLPKARARYLLLSGELLSGEDAERWGLVTFAVKPGQIETTVSRLVLRLAGRSRCGLATVKRMIANAGRLPQDQALHLERAIFLRHLESEDAAEGFAAFRDHRTPVFT